MVLSFGLDIQAVINPFYRMGAPIDTPSFTRAVARAAKVHLEGGRRSSSII